jgi:hypothetical protein
VDKGAHFYRSLQLDANGNPINKRTLWSTRSLAYVRLIPPGAADTVHYRMTIPNNARGRISQSAPPLPEICVGGTRSLHSRESERRERRLRRKTTTTAHGYLRAIHPKCRGRSSPFLTCLSSRWPKAARRCRWSSGTREGPPPARRILTGDDGNDYGIGLLLQGT